MINTYYGDSIKDFQEEQKALKESIKKMLENLKEGSKTNTTQTPEIKHTPRTQSTYIPS